MVGLVEVHWRFVSRICRIVTKIADRQQFASFL
jgi:hypothetical protein